MTRRPDPPQPDCPHCNDWGTVHDAYDPPDQYRPCPYCRPGTPQTSHERTIAHLITRHGRNPR